MEKTRICLDGTWKMTYCPIGEGTVEGFSENSALPYAVPGDIHTPLIEAGILPEPLEGTNSLDCRWVEDQEFWCMRRFYIEAADLQPVMQLTFEGLDRTADVYLNGRAIGRHNNAFVEVTWDVTKHLKVGENILLVRIDQGLAEAKTHELDRMGEMWNNDQPWRVWMRKPQFVYGWDWTIWLASCGIWKSVFLTGFGKGILTDVYAHPAQAQLTEDLPCPVAVEIRTDLRRDASFEIACRILDETGCPVAETRQTLTEKLLLTVPQAHLWWCNGMGKAYLYTVEVALWADGSLLDTHTQRLGLRTVSLLEPVLENGESGFTFCLNGENVFCKGANHVPCDCLPGRIPADRERRLVMLAQDSGMNMLRVWGGGVYASEAFLEACDQAGIMVWHDFMYACGYYPDHDPEFVENITAEATKAILRLRRHTSVIGWAGNNEIQEMYGCQKRWAPDLPWYGGRIYETILPGLVSTLCPTLIYRTSSPYGGEYQADCRHGDQHIWLLTHVTTHPHYLDLWRFTEFDVKFFSEFGVLGAMTMETAQSCIPPEHMHPSDPVWLHHTNSSMGGTLQEQMVRQYFGSGSFSAQQYILRSQAIQSEVTRHIYEEFRRKKFHCSGLLFWTLGDSYGVHNWSLIDYRLRRKPVYHALRQAMAPLSVCVRGYDVQNDEGMRQYRQYWANEPLPLEIWGMNDTRQDRSVDLAWSVLTTDGKCLLEGLQAVSLPANRSVSLARVDVAGLFPDPDNTLLRVRLVENGTVINESKYFFAPFAAMVPQKAQIRCSWRRTSENTCAVSLTADRFVWMAHLAEPDGTVYAENDFDLWPGEAKTVTVHTDDIHFTPTLHWIGKEEA